MKNPSLTKRRQEPIYEEEESSNYSIQGSSQSASSDLFRPEISSTQGFGNSSNSKSRGEAARTRKIGNGQRKDKNTYPNTLLKLKKICMAKFAFGPLIEAGQLGSEITVSVGKKNEKTIKVRMDHACAKAELIKFLAAISRYMPVQTKKSIRKCFSASVDQSIQTQRKKQERNPNYREACQESIHTLLLIKELVEECLREKGPVSIDDLTEKVFHNQAKKDRYNNGLKSIQKQKQSRCKKQIKKVESTQNSLSQAFPQGNEMVHQESEIIPEDNNHNSTKGQVIPEEKQNSFLEYEISSYDNLFSVLDLSGPIYPQGNSFQEE